MKQMAEKILELLDKISYVDLYENIYDEVKYINSLDMSVPLDEEQNYLLRHALHDLLIVLEDDTNYVLSEDNGFDELIQLLKTVM